VSVDDTAAWRPDPERDTSLLFDVFVLGQRAKALATEAMRDAGMSGEQYATSSVVFERGPITLTDLAAALGMPTTTVADAIRAMIEAGHVRRAPHPSDARAALLSLRPAGIRAHRRASVSLERAHRALAVELGDLTEASARATLRQLTRGAERALASLHPGVAARAG
jgi:DNA-binding MarR family transcriptional regulator